jgi:colanic acid/amylovoran biosynthesis glycosyltransferase
MKIAYLASLFPAPSHTFIQREIDRLRALGVEIVPFSVRRPRQEDILGEPARSTASAVKWLLPPRLSHLSRAVGWAALTRPVLSTKLLVNALSNGRGGRGKIKWLAYFVEALVLAWLIRRAGADHLHAHFGNAGSNTAALAAQLAHVPLSITFHGIDLDEPDLFRHAEKLSQCSFAVCISDHGRRLLAGNVAPADRGKIEVIRCGHALPSESSITPAPGANRIVSVARLSPEKGHEVLLDALSQLKRKGTPFFCTLVGGGPLESRLRDRIAALDLEQDVEMVGACPPEETMQFIERADLSVLASFGEGIPIALMEAFGFGRPVVATAVGGIPELVRDGENGKLVQPGDAAALADAIDDVVRDKARAAAMGRMGRNTVAGLHDPDQAALMLQECFSRSIEATAAHRKTPRLAEAQLDCSAVSS